MDRPLPSLGTPAAPARRVPPLFPWRFLLGVTTLLGLASGLRIYFTYNALGVEVSLLDGFGSGLMDWLLWIPLAPLAFWLAGRFDTEGGNAGSSLFLHVGAGVAASFAQLTLFAVVSSVVRAWRFGEAFHVNLSSPILTELVPGIAVYWILVLGWWWRASRSGLNELRRMGGAAPGDVAEEGCREAWKRSAEEIGEHLGACRV